jgi:hypothetical protein
MQAIRYERHFLTLIPAAIVFWLITKVGDAMLSGDGGFFLIYGAMGALHAASLVISLRDRSAVTLRKAIIFITLVGALSVLTVFSPILLVPVLSVEKTPTLGQTVRLCLVLAGGSAFGASGYWLLLRLFWLKSRRFLNLITTIALCSATTVASLLGAGSLTSRSREIADLMPTLGWWAAFSLSLYCGDLKWGAEKSIWTTSGDAHV